jgi:hypothetical protein
MESGVPNLQFTNPKPYIQVEKWSYKAGLGSPHKFYAMGLTIFIGLFSGVMGIVVSLFASQVPNPKP